MEGTRVCIASIRAIDDMNDGQQLVGELIEVE